MGITFFNMRRREAEAKKKSEVKIEREVTENKQAETKVEKVSEVEHSEKPTEVKTSSRSKRQ